MKLKALALVAMMFAAPAFAADLDVSLTDFAVIAGDGTALTAVQDLTVANLVGGVVADDTSFIVQEASTDGVAMIDQQAAAGLNFAAIVQTQTGAGAVAYIAQSGSNNRALISQHD